MKTSELPLTIVAPIRGKKAAFDRLLDIIDDTKDPEPHVLMALSQLYTYFLPATPARPKTDFDFVAGAMAKHDVRFYLNYVYSDGTNLVAADGHVLRWTQPDNPLPKGYYDRAGTKQDVDAQYSDWRAIIPESCDPVSPTVTERGHFTCGGEVIHYVGLDYNIRVDALYYDSAIKAMGSDILVGADMQRSRVVITDPARGWKTIIMPLKH